MAYGMEQSGPFFTQLQKKMVADAAQAAAAAGSVSAAAHTHAQYNFNYLST